MNMSHSNYVTPVDPCTMACVLRRDVHVHSADLAAGRDPRQLWDGLFRSRMSPEHRCMWTVHYLSRSGVGPKHRCWSSTLSVGGGSQGPMLTVHNPHSTATYTPPIRLHGDRGSLIDWNEAGNSICKRVRLHPNNFVPAVRFFVYFVLVLFDYCRGCVGRWILL